MHIYIFLNKDFAGASGIWPYSLKKHSNESSSSNLPFHGIFLIPRHVNYRKGKKKKGKSLTQQVSTLGAAAISISIHGSIII